MPDINLDQLRIELARKDLTRRELAQLLGYPPTTLASWLNGVTPPPKGLVASIEAALGLNAGTLSVGGP